MALIRLMHALSGWIVGLLLVPGLASAQLRQVPEGSAPELQEGQAWVVDGDRRPLDIEDLSFDLEVGELNYASDLVHRGRIEGAEDLVSANRGMRAIDWMSRAFPRIKKKHVFRYAGNVPAAFQGARQAPACCVRQRA